MKIEEMVVRALEQVNNDRYLLSVAIARRAEEIQNGAPIKLSLAPKNFKPADLALMEIAKGAIKVKNK